MISIMVTLNFSAPPNISSGAQEGTLAQRGFIKARDGWPYIPASAFKGQLRHAVERAASGMGRTVCTTHRRMCQEWALACPACRIFGSPWLPGRLHLVDLVLSGPPELVSRRETSRIYPLHGYRYGVSLNRRRKVAGDQLLYTTELFEPGVPVAFSGEMVGDLELVDAGWIVAGLNLFAAIGQGKTGGLGWLQATAGVQQEGVEISAAQLREALQEVPA